MGGSSSKTETININGLMELFRNYVENRKELDLHKLEKSLNRYEQPDITQTISATLC